MGILRDLLETVGLDPRRLQLHWISSAEGPRFAQLIRTFVETIQALGPLRWTEHALAECRDNVDAT